MASYRVGERMERDWGHWQVLAVGDGYVVKHIHILPGGTLSMQRHQHRTEVWTVLSGEGEASVEGKSHDFVAGESITFPRMAWHQVRNRGDAPLLCVEVQTGDWLDEADIERVPQDTSRPSA